MFLLVQLLFGATWIHVDLGTGGSVLHPAAKVITQKYVKQMFDDK